MNSNDACPHDWHHYDAEPGEPGYSIPVPAHRQCRKCGDMTRDDYSTVKAPLMHRYQLPARDGFEVVVGWDQPMRTYFAQVYGLDGESVLDRGDLLDPLATPQQALGAVRDYVTAVPPAVVDRLTEHAPGAAA